MEPYLRDPEEIYRRSFAIVRQETSLNGLPSDIIEIAVRLVHACGMPEIVTDLAWSRDFVIEASGALRSGRPIVTDVHMTKSGIIQNRLPKNNPVYCAISCIDAIAEAKRRGTTRSSIAIEKLTAYWSKGILVIGSAPTALFRVLELIENGATPPAAIIGFPVGFVGATESKDALINRSLKIPYLALRGRKGGSALAAATVNALCGLIKG